MNSSPIISGGVSPDLGHPHSAPISAPAHDGRDKGRDKDPEPEHDFRLVIEEDETPGADGAMIYKTFDRSTGQLVSSLPAEQVLHLGDAADYVAGAVIKTQA